MCKDNLRDKIVQHYTNTILSRWLKTVSSTEFTSIFINSSYNNGMKAMPKHWSINKSTAIFYGLCYYTLLNDVNKRSKLKVNHEPKASGFTAKLGTFYGVILWSIRV